MSRGRRRRPTHVVPADSRAEVVLVRDGAEIASWPLICKGGRVDLGAVNALARLQVNARREGCSVTLRDACPHLIDLLELVGLAGVLQVSRQAEGLEEGGVEEVVVPDDAVA